MTDRENPQSVQPRTKREALRSVESLFRYCDESRNPVLAYNKASVKVGAMARDGVRFGLQYVENALHERAQALVEQGAGQVERAREHHRACGRNLTSFQNALSELPHPRAPLSNVQLRARIGASLEAGVWSRAQRDIDELMRRPDIGTLLPPLDAYGRASLLTPAQQSALSERIDQCNARASEQISRGGSRMPERPFKGTSSSRYLEDEFVAEAERRRERLDLQARHREPRTPEARRRERQIQASVESLFRRCETSKDPVRTYSRACSKVDYLARDGVRTELHSLASALDERKNALTMERCRLPEKAREHNRECAEELRSFQRAVRAELARPRALLATAKPRERVHDSPEAGQWTVVRERIENRNAKAREQGQDRGVAIGATTEHPSLNVKRDTPGPVARPAGRPLTSDSADPRLTRPRSKDRGLDR